MFFGQVEDLEAVLKLWRGKAVVLVNPEWLDCKDVPSRHGAFVKSFDIAYCFQPVAIQVPLLASTLPHGMNLSMFVRLRAEC